MIATAYEPAFFTFALISFVNTVNGAFIPNSTLREPIIEWHWPPPDAVLLSEPFQIRLEYLGLIDNRNYLLKVFVNSALASQSVFNFDSLEGASTVISAPAYPEGPLLLEAEVWDTVNRSEEPLDASFRELRISNSWPPHSDSSPPEPRFSSVQCMGGVQQALEIFPSPRRVCMFTDVCWTRGNIVYFSDPELDRQVPAHSSLWSLRYSLLKVLSPRLPLSLSISLSFYLSFSFRLSLSDTIILSPLPLNLLLAPSL